MVLPLRTKSLNTGAPSNNGGRVRSASRGGSGDSNRSNATVTGDDTSKNFVVTVRVRPSNERESTYEGGHCQGNQFKQQKQKTTTTNNKQQTVNNKQ